MIYTLSLNPTLDYILTSENFELNKINKNASYEYFPGGKGINVSVMLKNLGVANTALGIIAGFSGKEIERRMCEYGCETDFFELNSGESRVNVKIRMADNLETDVNVIGPVISEDIVFEIIDKLCEKLISEDIIVLGGAVPKPLNEDIYSKILEKTSKCGCKAVVDSTGNSLLKALEYRPFLVKPNDDELGEIFGIKIENVQDAEKYGSKLMDMGAVNVAVSMGAKGALLLTKSGEKFFCPAAKGKAVSSIGAGDSFVAGFLYAINHDKSYAEAVRWGAAAGAATAFSWGIADKNKVEEILSRIELQDRFLDI